MELGWWLMDDSSDADDERELVGCFGEEDDEYFRFMDGKSNSPPSLTSTFDFTSAATQGQLCPHCQLVQLHFSTANGHSAVVCMPLHHGTNVDNLDKDGVPRDALSPALEADLLGKQLAKKD